MLRSSSIWFPKDSKAGSLETIGTSSTVNSSHPSRWRSVDLADLPLVTSASPADTNTGLARRWLRARGKRLAVYLSLAIAGHALLAFGAPFYRWAMRSHHGLRRTDPGELQATVPPECAHLKSPPPGWTFETSSSTGMPKSHQSSQSNQTSISHRHQLQMQTSQRGMTQACADQWIARSTVCENIRQAKHNLQEEDIDVAWSFVVPDEHWAKWKAHHEVQTSIVTGSAAARFRCAVVWGSHGILLTPSEQIL